MGIMNLGKPAQKPPELASEPVKRRVGILEKQDIIGVKLALQRAMSSIVNKKQVVEKHGAYWTQYQEWQRIYDKLEEE